MNSTHHYSGPATQALECSIKEKRRSRGCKAGSDACPSEAMEIEDFPSIAWTDDGDEEEYVQNRVSTIVFPTCQSCERRRGLVRSRAFQEGLCSLKHSSCTYCAPTAPSQGRHVLASHFRPIAEPEEGPQVLYKQEPFSYRLEERDSAFNGRRVILA